MFLAAWPSIEVLPASNVGSKRWVADIMAYGEMTYYQTIPGDGFSMGNKRLKLSVAVDNRTDTRILSFFF